MPVSTTLYTELRFAISNYIQSADWNRLFEVCGTADDETSRTIAVILSGYDSKSVWDFIDNVSGLSPEARQLKMDSVKTCTYTLARMGQTDVQKSLTVLKKFLFEGSITEGPASIALSNLWVLDPYETSKELLKSWISSDERGENLARLAVNSSEYLAQNDPKSVSKFLRAVSKIKNSRVTGFAVEMLQKYPQTSTMTRKSDAKRKKHKSKKDKKKKKHKKHKKK